jgi:putative endonuclease
MAEHNELGRIGEERAVEFLERIGYQILERNYTFDRSEIDIVCQDEEEIVVVEVKTRASSYLAGPEETVTKGKQNSIIKVANQYIRENEIDLECRFDIVSIILNKRDFQLEHLKDAFWPTK